MTAGALTGIAKRGWCLSLAAQGSPWLRPIACRPDRTRRCVTNRALSGDQIPWNGGPARLSPKSSRKHRFGTVRPAQGRVRLRSLAGMKNRCESRPPNCQLHVDKLTRLDNSWRWFSPQGCGADSRTRRVPLKQLMAGNADGEEDVAGARFARPFPIARSL